MSALARRVAALAGVVALAVGVTACGSDPRPAATIDGTPVTQQDVVDELEAIGGNADYVAGFEGGGLRVLGDEEGSYDAAFVASQLEVRIQYAIVSNEVDRRGLEADEECAAAGRAALADRFAGLSATGDGEAILDAFPDDYAQYLLDRETDVLLLQGDLIGQPCVSDSVVETYYEQNQAQFEQACASHILVPNFLDAADIIAELQAGADFATLAQERSQDTGSAAQGGELPCVGRGELVPEFEDVIFSAPVGLYPDPVETQFGFHVIEVRSRGQATLEEAADDIRALIAPRQRLETEESG